jgi:hypothetical protein
LYKVKAPVGRVQLLLPQCSEGGIRILFTNFEDIIIH